MNSNFNVLWSENVTNKLSEEVITIKFQFRRCFTGLWKERASWFYGKHDFIYNWEHTPLDFVIASSMSLFIFMASSVFIP